MMRRISISAILALGCAFVFCGSSAKGDTITVANGTQNTMTGVYTYNVTLTATAVISPQDGFVIYDFPQVMLGGTSFSWSAASLATLTTHGDAAATFNPQLSMKFNYVKDTLGNVSAPGGPANQLDALNTTLGGADLASIDNLSLVYSGPSFSGLGVLTGTLTVTTGVAGAGATTTITHYVSKDSGGGIFNGNLITVSAPGGGSSVPAPASLVGGGVIMLALGIGSMAKKSLRPAARV